MNPWQLVWAEWRVQRSAFRGVVLLLALALAFSISVGWIERGLRQAGADAAGRFDLLVGVAGSPTQLVLSAVYLQPQALPLLPPPVWDALRDDPGVAQVIPLASGDAVGPYPVVGSSAALVGGGRYFQLAEGRAYAAPDEAVIGADVDLGLGGEIHLAHGAPRPGARLDDEADGHDEDHHAQPLRIVGRLQATGTPWDRAVLMPIEGLWQIHAHGASGPAPVGQTPVLVVQPRTVADAYRLRAQWRRGGLMAVFPAEVLAELYGTLGDARRIVSGLAAGTQALVLGAGLLTVAVMLSTRRQAHAALRALGAPRRYLAALAWLLSMRVALEACLWAAPLAALMSLAARHAVQAGTGLRLVIQPQWGDLLGAVGLVVACSIGAAGLAWRACRRPVLEDLRS